MEGRQPDRRHSERQTYSLLGQGIAFILMSESLDNRKHGKWDGDEHEISTVGGRGFLMNREGLVR